MASNSTRRRRGRTRTRRRAGRPRTAELAGELFLQADGGEPVAVDAADDDRRLAGVQRGADAAAPPPDVVVVEHLGERDIGRRVRSGK